MLVGGIASLFDWQTVVSLGIVGGAMFVVLNKVFGWRGSLNAEVGGCGGGCSTCPAGGENSRVLKRVELIELE